MHFRPFRVFLALAALGLFQPLVVPTFCQQEILSRDSYVVTHWGTNEGLPTNELRPIVQTRDGYVWVGSPFGLSRFDGSRFEVLSPESTPGMKTSEVMSLAEDSKGRLWIGFFGDGILMYRDGHFSAPRFCSPIAQSTVASLFCDSSGGVYACTSEGVFHIQGDTGAFVTGLPEHSIRGFTGPDNVAYVFDHHFIRLSKNSEPQILASAANGNSYICIYPESATSFLAAEVDGIKHLRANADGSVRVDREWRLPLPSSFLPDGSGGYLVGTLGKGIVRFDGTRFTAPQGFAELKGPGLQVHNLIRDDEGGIWASTNGGAFRFAHAFFKTYGEASGLKNEYAWLVHLTKDGTLWVGAGRGGTYRIKNGVSRLFLEKDGMPDDQAMEMFEASNGNMWFGGYNGKISVLQSGRFKRLERLPGFEGGKIVAISEDAKHRIWLGTGSGLYSFGGDRFVKYAESDPDKEGLVRFVAPASNGDLWYVRRTHVVRMRNDTLTVFKPKNQRNLFGVFGIMLDGDRVWYGTYGTGLYLIRGDSVISLRSVCAEIGPRVISIIEDHYGYLWINAERELQRVRKSEILNALDHPGQTVKVDIYNNLDGLENIEFNYSSGNSAQMIPDGRILYASTSGVVVVDPSTAERPTSAPRVIIKRLIADDREVDLNNPVLPAGTRRVEIEYAALRFQSPGRIRFRAHMAGVDPNWVESDGRYRSASYTNPGYGEFTFRVTANSNGGPWNPSPASVSFSVKPYFFELWSFRIGCLLFTVFLLVLGYNFRVKRMRARNRVLEEEIRRRQEVERVLTSSLEEKTVMLKEIHHRVKNNMQVISSLMSLQLGAASEPMIQEALRESQARIRSMSLVHETLYRSENFAAVGLREYLKRLALQLGQSHQKLGVSISVEGDEVILSLDQAIPAGLLMNELLTNAYKHAFPDGSTGTIIITVRKAGSGVVELSVADSGKGLPEEFDISKTSTLGLRLVESLVSQLNGTFSVESELGTTATVKFRIERN
jgi:two-component sensor histidine kinase/ligand-binding sensor domain-containing protein